VRIELLPAGNEPLVETVAQWLWDAFWSANPAATRAQVRELVRKNAGSRDIPLTLVAYGDTGQALGTASLIECDLDSRRELAPWLAGVFVAPEARGLGVGSALCLRAAQELSRLGLAEAYLYTTDQTALYARLGWREHERIQLGAKTATIMRLAAQPLPVGSAPGISSDGRSSK
jgi:predicted N-acetyltransferase YhbS